MGASYKVMGDDLGHITFQTFGLLNVPDGFTLLEGQGADLAPVPFEGGVID